MIVNAILTLINTVLGWFLSTVGSLLGSLSFPLPAAFGDAVGFFKSLDAFFPVTEFIEAFTFLCSYFAFVWGVKWVVKLIDWLPFT
jgi:hypothetical protein